MANVVGICWRLIEEQASFKQENGKKIGNDSTAVKEGKVCVSVTELRHLFEHLNQLFTVDTVGVVVSGQFILEVFFVPCQSDLWLTHGGF